MYQPAKQITSYENERWKRGDSFFYEVDFKFNQMYAQERL